MTIMDTLLAVGVVVLAVAVKGLFTENKRLRSRLQVIEDLEPPFMEKVAACSPVPLVRITEFCLHMDERFWRTTLRFSEEDLKHLKQSISLHDDLSSQESEKFDRRFYADLMVRIQQWRGGHLHVEVCEGFSLAVRESFDLYPTRIGLEGVTLWRRQIPDTDYSPNVLGSRVQLDLYAGRIRLFGVSGRFGSQAAVLEPLDENIFLEVPLDEEGLSAFSKPHYRVEVWEDVFEEPEPWVRCYESIDRERGLAWRIWVQDIKMFSHRHSAEAGL